MEENSNMTAERSLEIITEQIAQSRKTVSKDVGQSLCVSGLYTMGMAVVVTVINIVAGNNGFTPFGHWLWMVLPIIIWLFMRNIHKGDAHTPWVIFSISLWQDCYHPKNLLLVVYASCLSLCC